MDKGTMGAWAKIMEPLRYDPPEDNTDNGGLSFADMIVQAWEKRMENDPETVKEEIENYLAFLPLEDRKQFLAEKLKESEG